VGVDDRLDDRQAEPRAVSVARALGREALEWSGESIDSTRVNDRARVGDRQKATSPRRSVIMSIRPGVELYARALSTRFASSRSARRGSPVIRAGARTQRTSIERSRARDWRVRRTCSARIARSNGSRLVSPACPRVSVRSASMRRSCCAPDASTRLCAARRDSMVASGSVRTSWMAVRCRASGVRSS